MLVVLLLGCCFGKLADSSKYCEFFFGFSLAFLCQQYCAIFYSHPAVKYNITGVCPPRAGHGNGGDNTNRMQIINLGLETAAIIEDTFNASVLNDCVFEVRTDPTAAGLFAVINRLNFIQKWPNGTCRDFIKVDYTNNSSESICDYVGMNDNSVRSFDSGNGRIRVRLHIDRTRAISSSEEDSDESDLDDLFHVSIILTSYFDCDHDERGGFSCFNNNERCIPAQYFRDNIINCVVPKCLDEANCFNADEDDVYSNLWSVIVIGLLSFCLTGSLVGIVLWSCWKRNFKPASSRSNVSGGAATHFELQQATGAAGGVDSHHYPSPSAPSSAIANSISTDDGSTGAPSFSTDLPPSYAILFPDK